MWMGAGCLRAAPLGLERQSNPSASTGHCKFVSISKRPGHGISACHTLKLASLVKHRDMHVSQVTNYKNGLTSLVGFLG